MSDDKNFFTEVARLDDLKKEARRRGVFEFQLNDGDCSTCPVRSVCEYVDEGTDECKLMLVAAAQLMDEVAASKYVTEVDALAIRTAAALYASTIYSERFFKVFGITRVIRGAVVYTEMYKDYLKILEQFNSYLSDLGLSPRGRKKNQGQEKSVSDGNALDRYVHARIREKTEEETRIEGRDRHNRLLQGQKPTQSALAGYARNNIEGDLRANTKPGAKKVAKLDGRGKRPKRKKRS